MLSLALSQSLVERDTLTAEESETLERLCSRLDSVRRYRTIRKYCEGVVLDAACGSGYGTHIISKCPSVTRAIGIDRSEDAIAFARREYPSVEFVVGDVVDGLALNPDVVVSVETLEHLPDPDRWLRAVSQSSVKRVVLSFPSYPTTAFNPHHLTDIAETGIVAHLGQPSKRIDFDDNYTVLVYER